MIYTKPSPNLSFISIICSDAHYYSAKSNTKSVVCITLFLQLASHMDGVWYYLSLSNGLYFEVQVLH